MPIYEYYCRPCNRIFSFFSHTVNPDRQPACPKCGAKKLKKLLSGFAVLGATRKSTERTAGDADAPENAAADTLDPRAAAGMEQLMEQADGLDENDPRQLGRFMRRMTELTGAPADHNLETAIRRLEAGEDPEKIQDDMGDLLDGGDETDAGGGASRRGAPAHDDGMYTF